MKPKWYQMKITWVVAVVVLFISILSIPTDDTSTTKNNYNPPVKNTANVIDSIKKEIVETPTKTQEVKVTPPKVKSVPKASFSGDTSTQQKSCHSSYSGCLNPNASDYDCAGGSGNGPYYTGRVTVYGPDVFGLDRDGDGIGCE
jgi:hypothetical protein